MTIIRLAFFNVWRRLGRSILALMAMAVAAAVLTSGLSISRGVPRLALSNYREIFGGDIVVFAPGFVGAAPITESDAPVVRRQVIDSGFSSLLKYYPVLRDGYYAHSDWEYQPLDSAMMQELLAEDFVANVSAHHFMPGLAEGKRAEFRPLPDEMWHSEDPFTFWHYDIDVVLNRHGGFEADVGDLITLQFPAYSLDAFGLPYADSSLPPLELVARVVGKVRFYTRTIMWMGEMGVVEAEAGYVHSPDVFLTADSWRELWSRQSGGSPFMPLSAGISIEDMSELNVRVSELRRAYPELAFFTIAEFVEHLNAHALLDRFYRAPPLLWRPEFQARNPMARQDFGMVTAILLFLNSGMLLASQMLTAVASRRNEIGILKAIGARNWDVVGMIMLEAVIIALLGATAGFTLVRAAGIHMALTNSAPLLEVMKTTVNELALVLGLTLAASLVFGVLPAWKVAKLTVMEVFRNE